MKMPIAELITAVENVDFREFWWGSELLKLCSGYTDQRLINALVYRHHGLSNKAADSCHVIRQTIKTMDGPSFCGLWACIESATDEQEIIGRMDDLTYMPWAAGFILGEIGGLPALEQIESRLTIENERLQYMLVRLISQVIVRYSSFLEDFNPQMSIVDLKTGVQRQVSAKEFPEQYARKKLRYNQEIDYFHPIPKELVIKLNRKLTQVPDWKFNIHRDLLFKVLAGVQHEYKRKLLT